VDDELLCGSCVTSPRKEASMTQPVRKVAHDSGDGETIYHCFSCGSGKVVARSDRSTECMYCGQVFTVQVQPQFAAFPQTINGMPTPVPGMPGQIDGGGLPGADPMGGNPMDPNAMDQDGGFPPDEAGDEAEENDGDETDSDSEDSDAPPWAKKSSLLRTSLGHELDPDDFVRHLAIRHSVSPRAMAGLVKAERAAR
jgi:DNA-directed RNA polymerase subunit RPC12/RpoP